MHTHSNINVIRIQNKNRILKCLTIETKHTHLKLSLDAPNFRNAQSHARKCLSKTKKTGDEEKAKEAE